MPLVPSSDRHRMLALAVAALPARAASLDGLAVDVKNESEPVLCAEKDNVAVSFPTRTYAHFASKRRTRFISPPACATTSRPTGPRAIWLRTRATRRRARRRMVTLYEDTKLWIVGYRIQRSGALDRTTVRVGDHVEKRHPPVAGLVDAERTAPRKCSFSIRRTATGARVR